MTVFGEDIQDFQMLNAEELQNIEGGIGWVTGGLIVLGLSYGSGILVGLSGG